MDINAMADELQSQYREYAKRKRSAFRAAVKKAYSVVLNNYGNDDNGSTEDDDDDDEEEDLPEDHRYVRMHLNYCVSVVNPRIMC